MTQMVGRALRGVKAGGTEQAFVVSFVDNWNDKIAWVNPEQPYCEEESAAFPENSPEYRAGQVRWVANSKIEEFAEMMDDSLKGEELAKLYFIRRVPVGLYSFTLLLENKDEGEEKPCQIVVYDNLAGPYAKFMADLPRLFKSRGLAVGMELDFRKLSGLAGEVERKYFSKSEASTFLRRKDILNILEFFSKTGSRPTFFEFKEREKFDLAKVATTIYDRELGGA
jgi:ATP-dependent helicase IRC3